MARRGAAAQNEPWGQSVAEREYEHYKKSIEQQKLLYGTSSAASVSTNATISTRGGNWSRDSLSDTHTFHYPCGHGYQIPGNVMQRGGQVAPPICPACHGQKVIDQMEAENWNRDPKWQGWAPRTVSKGDSVPVPLDVPSGALAWLDYQIGRVRQVAWQ